MWPPQPPQQSAMQTTRCNVTIPPLLTAAWLACPPHHRPPTHAAHPPPNAISLASPPSAPTTPSPRRRLLARKLSPLIRSRTDARRPGPLCAGAVVPLTSRTNESGTQNQIRARVGQRGHTSCKKQHVKQHVKQQVQQHSFMGTLRRSPVAQRRSQPRPPSLAG